MNRFALAACATLLTPLGAHAQSADQLIKGATDTSNVLNYGMGYNLQRFSPLTQINRDNAKDLVPLWNYSFADDRSEESQPLVYQGVVYVTTHNATMAIDAKTGKQIWKSKIEYPARSIVWETPGIFFESRATSLSCRTIWSLRSRLAPSGNCTFTTK